MRQVIMTFLGVVLAVSCGCTTPKRPEQQQVCPDSSPCPDEVCAEDAEQTSEVIGTDAVPSPYSLVAAFDVAKKFTGDATWLPVNAMQEKFVHYLCYAKQISKLPPEVLDAIASQDHRELNEFLKERGFTIELKPFNPGDFGAVAVFEIGGEWRARRESITVDESGTKYPAVQLPTPNIFAVPGHKNPVARIWGDPGAYAVYISIWDESADGFDVIEKATALTPTSGTPYHPDDYEAVCFPMIDLDLSMQMEWLLGMRNSHGDCINQALQQVRLKANEFGFATSTGVAVGATRGHIRTTVVNKPFLFWVTGPGLTHPLFAAVVTPEYWKDPGAIATSQK